MISPEEFMNCEICQKTLGRQQLETFELVGAFYNVLEPESRYDFIRSILDERGALLARYHNLICNDLAPKLRKKQIRYRPDQYSVEFIPAAESVDMERAEVGADAAEAFDQFAVGHAASPP